MVDKSTSLGLERVEDNRVGDSLVGLVTGAVGAGFVVFPVPESFEVADLGVGITYILGTTIAFCLAETVHIHQAYKERPLWKNILASAKRYALPLVASTATGFYGAQALLQYFS